jgi:hypothetical protein
MPSRAITASLDIVRGFCGAETWIQHRVCRRGKETVAASGVKNVMRKSPRPSVKHKQHGSYSVYLYRTCHGITLGESSALSVNLLQLFAYASQQRLRWLPIAIASTRLGRCLLLLPLILGLKWLFKIYL